MYLYANADPVGMADPTGHDSEYYTSTNGIAAHILFSAYVRPRGFTPHFFGPDATRGNYYYDLKPITHFSNGGAQLADYGQMSGYVGTWGTPGNSTDIVPNGDPLDIGQILGDDGTVFSVTLYTQRDPTEPSGFPGTGIVLYELTPDESGVGFPVPETVPAPSLRPYQLQSPTPNQRQSPSSPSDMSVEESYGLETIQALAEIGALGGLAVTGYYAGAAAEGAAMGGTVALGAL